MTTLLTDILGRAEKLSSVNYQDQIGTAVSSAQAGTVGESQAVPWVASKAIDSDLQSIFRASESLWNNAKTRALKKDVLFGEKGVIFGVSAPELDKAVEVPPTTSTEDEEIDADVARVKLEAEMAFFNHVLLSKPHSTLNAGKKILRDGTTANVTQPIVAETVTSRRELLFGDRIRKYIKSGKKRDLGELLNAINADPNTDSSYVSMWSEAVALINQKLSGDRDDVACCIQLIDKAVKYLSAQYVTHMSDVVERNRELAVRGGIPGIGSLVTAFLKISPDEPDSEEGVVNGLPVWEVTYNCFRAGDLTAAADALSHLRSFPQSACLVQALTHLSKYETLDAEIKKKLKVEWRHNQTIVRDKFKRSLYIALLGGDAPLADTMENWLWFKLITLKTHPEMTPALYMDLQKMVSVDFGEAYFMRNGDYQYYFTALWLSGQFERAIDLLANCGLLVEAVHLAILANETGYLRCNPDTSADLLVVDSAQLTKASLNMPKLVVIYTKEFEVSDPARAMDYCFLLRGFKTPGGSDVFEKAVSRTVYLLDNREAMNQLLGELEPNGHRRKGLIDEYLDDPSGVIETVAQDTELGGQCEEAVYIYLLANRPIKAVQLLSASISENLRSNLENAKHLREVARECEPLLARADASEFSTLAILIDLVAIFDACAKDQTRRAYEWSRDLRIIPTDPDSVSVIIKEFHMVPQKVRDVIPDLCLTLMKSLVHSVQGQRDPDFVRQVRAIVMYAATAPHSFPQHIKSDLLKLQASVAV